MSPKLYGGGRALSRYAAARMLTARSSATAQLRAYCLCRPVPNMRGMDHSPEPKQQLPFPFNMDLSKVLRHLARVTGAARERLANSTVTAAYLAAAMRLVKRHLGPGEKRAAADSEDKNSVMQLLGFVSQREVVKEFKNNEAPFPRSGSVATMRCTWKSHSHFIADLLRFGLSAVHYPVSRRRELENLAEDAISGEDFLSAARRLCYWDLNGYLTIPMFRLQLVAAASCEGNRVIQEAIAERYAETTGEWKIIYERFLEERGLRCRDGVSLDQIADLLSAVAEGLALRQLADPKAQVIDHDREDSLLGTAALALISAFCVDSTDTTALSFEQSVREMVH